MSKTRTNSQNIQMNNKTVSNQLPAVDWSLTARKAGLSLLVIAGFAGYALAERPGIVNSSTSAQSATGAQAITSNNAANNNIANNNDNTAAQSSAAGAANVPVANSGYKDGSFTGSTADAYYGNVQVVATIQGGKITDVKFLDYPHDRRTSQMINQQAMPYLDSEAIQVQTAQVDIISGATFTSEAFQQSLQSALDQAKP